MTKTTCKKRPQIIYLIDSLASGGAQRQLIKLVSKIDKSLINPLVIVYHDIPFFRKELLDANVPLLTIKKNDKIGVSFFFKFVLEVRRQRPLIIHSFLNVPNIYARLAKLFCPIQAIVTSERNISLTDRYELKIAEMITWRLSNIIITNTHKTKDILINKIGIDSHKIRVIYNGIEDELLLNFNQNKVDCIRKKCRAKNKRTFLIGLIGRVVPQKNHIGLIEAIKRVKTLIPDIELRVGFWGSKPDKNYFETLKRIIDDAKLSNDVFFFGIERDIASVYAACDIVVLPSLWEGLPNVVLEAMSAKRLVIASDIVDNSRIIFDGIDGFLFQSQSVESLVETLLKTIQLPEMEKKTIRELARKKVLKDYSIEEMVEKTMTVYRELGLC